MAPAVRETLSDEQLVAYLDAAHKRRGRDFREEFEAGVEAARMGTVFAHNVKAYRSWRRTMDRHAGRKASLSAEALEATVRSLATTHPEYVVTG